MIGFASGFMAGKHSGYSMTSSVSSLLWAFETGCCLGLEDWLLWHECINVAGN